MSAENETLSRAEHLVRIVPEEGSCPACEKMRNEVIDLGFWISAIAIGLSAVIAAADDLAEGSDDEARATYLRERERALRSLYRETE